MNANARTQEKRTGTRIRPRSFPLGTDSDGAHHVYLVDELAVHVVTPDDVERFDVSEGEIDDWMDFVAAERGWSDPRYGQRAVADRMQALAAEVADD